MIERGLHAVHHLANASFASAMRAAEHHTARFDAVADDAALAMLAFRSHDMNGAFEAIEVVRDPVLHDFQRLVVFIAAGLASRPPMLIKPPSHVRG